MCVLALALFAAPAFATKVSFNVQPRQTYLGVPVTLSISIDDASAPPPQLPDMADFTLMGSPSRSEQSFVQIINGRRTSSSSITYTYRLMPTRAGMLTIPAIRFEIAGEAFETNPTTVNVLEPTNDGILSAEIIAAKKSVYVGEPLQLILRITVKPYIDDRYPVRLSDGDMWSLLASGEGQWGAFQPAIDALQQARRAPPSRVVRPDGSLSDDDLLYQYDIVQAINPQRAGALDVGNVVLVMQYPIELSRFFGSYSIERSRPVVAAPSVPEVTVKPLPEEGRPDIFSGAVGNFTMGVSVKPVDVAVGEPITLTLTITDQSRPATQLDVLKAPPLHLVEALTKDFRVHDEPLAGTVSGRSKSFTQTIRAEREGITAVPAIPFAYFDPEREAYVTITSDPIPITVRPASALAMSDIVQSDAAQPRSSDLTPTSGGILANYGDVDSLLRRHSLDVSWWLIALLALPPMMFGAVAIGHHRAERRRRDPAMVRQRGAFKRAQAMIGQAAGAANGAESHIAAAVAGYVADRCNLPPGAHARGDIVSCLTQKRVDAQLVAEVGSLLERCEHAAYTGSASGASGHMAREAEALISKLERARWS